MKGAFAIFCKLGWHDLHPSGPYLVCLRDGCKYVRCTHNTLVGDESGVTCLDCEALKPVGEGGK
jgi:hypothetical protein